MRNRLKAMTMAWMMIISMASCRPAGDTAGQDDGNASMQAAYFPAGLMLINTSAYIDSTGSVALSLPGAVCTPFDPGTGLALVRSENGAYGYIGADGGFVIEPVFEFATPFQDGVARVVSKGKAGVITPDGKYAVSPVYAAIGEFGSGLAPAVREGENGYEYGYIDVSGKTIIAFDGISKGPFAGGVAPVQDGVIGSDGKYLLKIKDAYISQPGTDFLEECLAISSVSRADGLLVVICTVNAPGGNYGSRVDVFDGQNRHILSSEGDNAVTATLKGEKTLYIRRGDASVDAYRITGEDGAVFDKTYGALPCAQYGDYVIEIADGVITAITGRDGQAVSLPDGEAAFAPDSDGLVPVKSQDGTYRFYRIGGDFVTEPFETDWLFIQMGFSTKTFWNYYAFMHMNEYDNLMILP